MFLPSVSSATLWFVFSGEAKPTGPKIILTLKVLVTAVTVLFAAAVWAILTGRRRLQWSLALAGRVIDRRAPPAARTLDCRAAFQRARVDIAPADASSLEGLVPVDAHSRVLFSWNGKNALHSVAECARSSPENGRP